MTSLHIKRDQLPGFEPEINDVAYWKAQANEWETRYDRAQTEYYQEISILRNDLEKLRAAINGQG